MNALEGSCPAVTLSSLYKPSLETMDQDQRTVNVTVTTENSDVCYI